MWNLAHISNYAILQQIKKKTTNKVCFGIPLVSSMLMRLPSFLVLACMRACDEGPPVGDWGEVGLLGLSAVLDRAVFGDLVGGGGGTDLNRLCPGPLLGAGPVLA